MFFVKTVAAVVVVAFFSSANTKRQTCDSVADNHLPTYDGVTVVIKLTNSTSINCLGILMTSQKYIPKRKYQHVLTSAGCVKQKNIDNVRVYIKGNPFIENKNKKDVYEVEKIIYHPNYNDTTHIGDVALIRMSTFKILPQNVQPYKLSISQIDIDSPNVKAGTLFWKPGKANQQDTPFYISKQAITIRRDPQKCPFSNVLNGKNENEFGYMFICSKLNKTKIDAPGGMLMACEEQSEDGEPDPLKLSLLGLYSYSYTVDNEQVVKYTFLDWYIVWILTALKRDIIQLERELLSTTTVRPDTTATSVNYNTTLNIVVNTTKKYYEYNDHNNTVRADINRVRRKEKEI